MKQAGGILPDFHERARREFDRLAPYYDREVGQNLVGIRMRNVLREWLSHTFASGDLIFEVGSGTGLDAIYLAHRGVHVVATDISEGMLQQLRQKASKLGLKDCIDTVRLPAYRIGDLSREWGEESFDGGFSHAGALNMEPRIEDVPPQLHRLVKTGGNFVCSVINKLSLFELLFYPLILKPRKAYRRLGNVIPLPISTSRQMRRSVIPSIFLSPRDLMRLFSVWFALEEMRGLQILLPPHNLENVYRRLWPLMRPLEAIEDRLAHRRPMNWLGHYTLARFRRSETMRESV